MQTIHISFVLDVFGSGPLPDFSSNNAASSKGLPSTLQYCIYRYGNHHAHDATEMTPRPRPIIRGKSIVSKSPSSIQSFGFAGIYCLGREGSHYFAYPQYETHTNLCQKLKQIKIVIPSYSKFLNTSLLTCI